MDLALSSESQESRQYCGKKNRDEGGYMIGLLLWLLSAIGEGPDDWG
jgi:hypothetical protein